MATASASPWPHTIASPIGGLPRSPSMPMPNFLVQVCGVQPEARKIWEVARFPAMHGQRSLPSPRQARRTSICEDA
jgi:hypothetical protein